MNLEIDRIRNSGEYRHLETIAWADIIPFVIRYLKNYSAIIVIYALGIMASALFALLTRIDIAGMPYHHIFATSAAGLILTPFLLVVPHELIHIIIYYLYGARSIKIGRGEGMAYFYVASHNFPMRSPGYAVVALAPIVIITIALLVLMQDAEPLMRWFLALTLLSHTVMSCGDIAIVNFLWLNRRKGVVAWDDTEKKEAVFYCLNDNSEKEGGEATV